jgi:hypothetical protein
MMIQINFDQMVCLYDNEPEAKAQHVAISAELKANGGHEKAVLKIQKVRSVGVTSAVWVLTVVSAN